MDEGNDYWPAKVETMRRIEATLQAKIAEQAETIKRLRAMLAEIRLIHEGMDKQSSVTRAIGIALSQETPATKDPCNDHICAKCGWHFGIADRDIEIQL